MDPLSLFAIETESEKQQKSLHALAPKAPIKEEILRQPHIQKSNPRERRADFLNDRAESPSKIDAETAETDMSFLSGEKVLMRLTDLLIQSSAGKLIPGTLVMTTYRLHFQPSPSQLALLITQNPSITSMLSVPLGCIAKIEREKKLKDAKNMSHTIIISCKDMRQLKLYILTKTNNPAFPPSVTGNDESSQPSEAEMDLAFSAMSTFAFPNNVRHVFAFSHSFLGGNKISQERFRVGDFDYAAELIRQGVLDDSVVLGGAKSWRISHANSKFALCNSYPRAIVVPASMTDDDLLAVAAFRSGHRLPAMTWISADNGASLWRSSQPKGGVSSTCYQDENMLEILSKSCITKLSPRGHFTSSGDPLLVVIDCRSKASAMANRAAGAGYELPTNYPTTRVEFMNIGNIHTMRESLRSLSSAMFDAASLSPGELNIFSIIGSAGDSTFGKQVEDSGWLTHIRLILKAAWETASILSKGIPVLVHCSHGK